MRQFSEQELVRREKLKEISKVCNPYPERYEVTHSLKRLVHFRMKQKEYV